MRRKKRRRREKTSKSFAPKKAKERRVGGRRRKRGLTEISSFENGQRPLERDCDASNPDFVLPMCPTDQNRVLTKAF